MMNITIVSENMCRQLMKLQDTIAAREDGCPTFQEINMQVKLINSIDKLSRLAARMAKEEARTAALATQPPVAQNVAQQQPDFIYDDPPPVTGADAVEFSYIVDEVSATNAEVTYKGKSVRVDWMLYNLFQFTLPVQERRFINNPDAMYIIPADTAQGRAA